MPPAKVTPVGAVAGQLVDAGVPIGTIVSMIEEHYAAALSDAEGQLREALLGTVHAETLKHSLKRVEDRNRALAEQLQQHMDARGAVQQQAIQVATREHDLQVAQQQLRQSMSALERRQAADDELVEMADAQQQRRSPQPHGQQPPSERSQLTTLHLQVDQLTRQLDAAKVELRDKTKALEHERAARQRLEAENHTLNLHTMGAEDEKSRVSGNLEAARQRSKEQSATFDSDRQRLLADLSDARSELQSTKQRADTESAALTSHIRFLESELSTLRTAHAELREDYLAVTKRNDPTLAEMSGAGSMEASVRGRPAPKEPEESTGTAPAHSTSVHIDAVKNLQHSLEEVTQRAQHFEEENRRLRAELLAAQSTNSAVEPHLLSMPRQPLRALVAASPPLSIKQRADDVATPPPPVDSPQQRGLQAAATPLPQRVTVGVAPAATVAVTPEPSWSSSVAVRAAVADKAHKQHRRARRSGEHDAFRGDADPAALRRLRGPPTVVSIDGAAAFVASVTPIRMSLKPKPHRGRPLPPVGEVASPASPDCSVVRDAASE